MLQVGQLVGGRFRVLRVLGQGGMGAVYVAEQLGLGRHVALKVMHPHIASAPGFSERFQREAQVLARLRHPGSVEVYDYGLDSGFLYLAMELVSGETVESLLRREGSLPVLRAVDLTVQVLEVLEAAHVLGIIHRDLKPANLFLERHDGRERVKVLDFGLAALGGELNVRLTQEGMAVGTPGFMSPEQMRGLPLDGRSDLYSVGCVLYELLTGVPPFPVMVSAETAVAHLYKPVPSLRGTRPGISIPERLEATVMKALEKLPELRPADAAAMRQELLAVLEEPLGPAAPKKRGEGKKTERGVGPARHEVPVPKPVAGGLPVGVVASREGSTENTLVMSLLACGFQARVVSTEEPLGELGALLFVADGRESLVRARSLASRPGAPPVLLCGPADDWELVTGALEGGLFDFVPLPLDSLDLTRKVSRAQKSKR
ncbi:serine/threonine-protein kinase [Archangium lipolyticum]|uniref:serine/threonine-protein kinase n=1 Tax=Archangium lipolyticum TaxID=2970465 RepID=UPI002149EB8C|nr:serine/threonine-protein kinase [Archangium lipolyticum]